MTKDEGIPEHYTAVIEVTKTTDSYQPKNPRGYNEGNPTERKTKEVARLVVRDDDLERLKQKLAKHIELIDD